MSITLRPLRFYRLKANGSFLKNARFERCAIHRLCHRRLHGWCALRNARTVLDPTLKANPCEIAHEVIEAGYERSSPRPRI
jgi:hypothetical protein